MAAGGHWMAQCFAALITVVAFVSASHAKAPTIVDQHDKLRATITPSEEWCSPVVTVDIHGNRRVFKRSGEEVQRFIGAIRASVLEGCPMAEIIRLHAFARGVGIFLAYTTKESGWSIKVFPDSNAVLSVLQSRKTGAALSREFAYYETRTLFERARLPSVDIDRSDPNTDHVNWRLDHVYGATYVLSDHRRNHRSLSALANATAKVFARQCVGDGAGMLRDATNGIIAPNVVTRTFRCLRGQVSVDTEIIVKEVDNMTIVVVASSADSALFKAAMGFIASKDLLY